MSLESLPDELLLNIVQLCVDLFHVDDVFYGAEDPGRPPSDGLVWCKYWKIASLSAVNARLWRISSPSLFSSVILFAVSKMKNGSHDRYVLEPAVGVLGMCVFQRPEIAQHIRSIQAIAPHGSTVRHLTDDAVEAIGHVIHKLPNLKSIHELPIPLTNLLLQVINNHRYLSDIEVLGTPRVQARSAMQGNHHDFLVKIRFRGLDMAFGVLDDATSNERINDICKWLDLGMRINKLEFWPDAEEDEDDDDKRVNLRSLRIIPPSSVDRVYIKMTEEKNPDYNAKLLHDLEVWLRDWPSSTTPDISFHLPNSSGSLSLLCPDIRSDNLNFRYHLIRALSAQSASESSFPLGGREWAIVEVGIRWDWNNLSDPSDRELGFYLPDVEELCIYSSVDSDVITWISMASLASFLGQLPRLRHLWISAEAINLRNFGNFNPISPRTRFARLDFDIRRQVIEFIRQNLRQNAPSLQKVTLLADCWMTEDDRADGDQDIEGEDGGEDEKNRGEDGGEDEEEDGEPLTRRLTSPHT